MRYAAALRLFSSSCSRCSSRVVIRRYIGGCAVCFSSRACLLSCHIGMAVRFFLFFVSLFACRSFVPLFVSCLFIVSLRRHEVRGGGRWLFFCFVSVLRCLLVPCVPRIGHAGGVFFCLFLVFVPHFRVYTKIVPSIRFVGRGDFVLCLLVF